MTNPGVFKFIGESVEAATSVFVTAGVSNVIGAIAATALTGATLYFTIMGYMMIAGRIEVPVQEFTIKGVKIALIGFFALSAGNFTAYVMGGLNGLEAGLSAAIGKMGTAPPPANVYEAIDGVLDKGLENTSTCFRKGGDASGVEWRGKIPIIPTIRIRFDWFIAGLVMAASTCVLGLAGGVMILLAKLMLSILFVLGPFFVMLLMFPATARYFDGWMGQAMTYVMTVVVITAVFALAIFCFDHQLDGLKIDDMDAEKANPIFMAFQVLVLTAVFTKLIYSAGSMAGSIGGGMGLAAVTFGQFINSTLRGKTGGQEQTQEGGEVQKAVQNQAAGGAGAAVQARKARFRGKGAI
jgi:type IV secretion system protein VirB6